ncbi:NAD(P)H-binding protein [Nonomuraea sp. NBC_01738]|uniref:NAD(P)H-binding protein n=1 Tax=Nonomuraea sp. NBC_01738 TaxID=2976003 RepID=UPI002E163D40|nr:NAD(P)H-binding protein [Nonomuraea sp. NBC_01738]
MILVTGATGRVGGQVVRQLAGVDGVRALVRDPGRADLPVEAVRGDLSDPASLDAALDGVDKVFLVWPTLKADHAMAETVKRFAGRHVVYFSAATAGADDPINASHGEMERLLRESGADWTFLRITGLAANDLKWADSVRNEGVVREPFAGWARSHVHEADLAAAAVRTLTEDGHAGKTYLLTGPQALTPPERVAVIADVLGRAVRFEESSPEEVRRQYEAIFGPELAAALVGKGMDGTREPVTSTIEQLTGHPARNYREWVAEHWR